MASSEQTDAPEENRAPVVSVIIPVYNTEEYLRECLESAAMQTLRDIEIICVNDGSTDASPEILREYAARDSRFRIVDRLQPRRAHLTKLLPTDS